MTITRRGLLAGSLAALARRRAPAIHGSRPAITHGVQAGDPHAGTAQVWARASEPARMLVEWDITDRFANPRRVLGPVVGPDRDHTGIARLSALPAGQTVHYRVRFEREAARGGSAWASGTLRTARGDRLRLAWTGDTCGQGFGRNPEWGGLRGYAAIRAADPDVLVHSGDLIYADNPIPAERPVADGRVWRNVSNEHVARVAESLDDFRARFAYNLEDDHVRALAAQVPIIAQWDDHETHNDWWPGEQLADPRYRERDASRLAGRALHALREWVPIAGPTIHRVVKLGPLADVFVLDARSFRSPNGANLGDDAMLGATQLDWLLRALVASRARWKIVACDQPLALVISDTGAIHEGFANGDPGEPRGREREIASLLRHMALGGPRDASPIRNVVWITADVHYAAAHHFDPARARIGAFDPFWELVAGPIHAGSFGPNPLDPSLGAEVRFQWAPEPGREDVGPWDGLQSFGTLDVTPEALTATLWGIDDKPRFTVEIPAA
jgi:alkaline phosphatase D